MTEKPKFFYGWFNALLAFTSITTYGLFYSYGVFIEPLEAELQSPRAALSLVYTLELAAYCSFATPCGWFCDKYGPRKTLWLAALFIGGGTSLCSLATSVWHLCLFFGVIAAFGHSAIWVAPTSTINRWFIKRRGLAMGIALCGLGVGLLVVPPVTAHIIHLYNWKAAFIFLGALFFILNLTVGTFIRRRPEDMGLQPLGVKQGPSILKEISGSAKDFSVSETLRSHTFWRLYMVFLFCFAAEQMVLVHIVPYGRIVGIPTAQGALGLSFLGVGTIVGRLAMGALSDRIGRVASLIMCAGIESGAIFLILAVKGPPMLYSTMFILGLVYGGTAVICAASLGDFFGLTNIGAIMGVWATSGVFAGILGPLMAGIIFDVSGSYFWAITIAGSACIGAVIAAASIRLPRQ